MSTHYTPIEVRGREPVEIVELPGRLDPAESLEFTYYVKTDGDLVKVTGKIAEEETTGRWIGRGTPTGLFHAARAEAVRIERYDRGDGVVTIRAPLANLDPPHQSDWLLLVRDLVAQGKTVVSVLHEVSFALQADDVAIIAAGRLRHHGSTQDTHTHRALEQVFDDRIAIHPVEGQWLALPVCCPAALRRSNDL